MNKEFNFRNLLLQESNIVKVLALMLFKVSQPKSASKQDDVAVNEFRQFMSEFVTGRDWILATLLEEGWVEQINNVGDENAEIVLTARGKAKCSNMLSWREIRVQDFYGIAQWKYRNSKLGRTTIMWKLMLLNAVLDSIVEHTSVEEITMNNGELKLLDSACNLMGHLCPNNSQEIA